MGYSAVEQHAGVSVVMPLYNKAAFVKSAVSSVIQYQGELELLVVDDGSTDAGPDIVASMTDPRVRLIQQPNMGASAARNAGIRAARHDLVAFLDADDWWLPGHLEELLPLAARFPNASLFADQLVFRSPTVAPPRAPLAEVLDLAGYASCVAPSYPVSSSTALARRPSLLAAGLFREDYSLGEDHAMWLRLAQLGDVVVLGRPGAVYRKVEGSVVGRLSVKPNAAMREISNILRTDVVLEAARELAALRSRFAMSQAVAAMRHGRRVTARRFLSICKRDASWSLNWQLLRLLSVLPKSTVERLFAIRYQLRR